MEHVDVLIVGAGLSGIGAGYHLQKKCPDRTYLVLEGRADMGGTWDLFRYPGIRSDSDMYTLGYVFKPWTQDKSIADGASILEYIRETARENRIDQHIRYGHQVKRAGWNGSRWHLEVEMVDSGERIDISCNFLLLCCGYYSYKQGYTPEFPGSERFTGPIIHPQHWPEHIDYDGKNVVVIGSGATAMTIVPEMAQSAGHVTMLQRSPTYVLSMPARDGIANRFRRWFGIELGYQLARLKNVVLGLLFFKFSRALPEKTKQLIVNLVRSHLGPDYDVDKHFTPKYNPWDQRLCLVPDEDLFKSIRAGKTSVVTDEIDTFTDKGIRLTSGEELPADLIVTATGLNLQVAGNIELVVDDRPVDLSESFTYKGMMLSDVPNLAVVMGYTNASWTLKADLTCTYMCRLLTYMRRHHYESCIPRNNEPSMDPEPLLDFTSGYVQRSIDSFPKQGSKAPWKLHQNYFRDLIALKYGSITDPAMEFRKGSVAENRAHPSLKAVS